eukprot:423511-Amphidinium_carterae.1
MQWFGRYPGWRGAEVPFEALLQDVVTPIPGCPGRVHALWQGCKSEGVASDENGCFKGGPVTLEMVVKPVQDMCDAHCR